MTRFGYLFILGCAAVATNALSQSKAAKVPKLPVVTGKMVSVGPRDGATTAAAGGVVSIDFGDFKPAAPKPGEIVAPAPGSGQGGIAGDQALRALLSKLGAPAPAAAGGETGGAAVQELSSGMFDQSVLQSPKPVVVTFHATWCGPCKRFAPTIKSAAAKMPEVTFVRVDIDQCEQIANRYGVSSVPTIMLFKNGQQVDKFTGGTNLAGIQKLVSAAH